MRVLNGLYSLWSAAALVFWSAFTVWIVSVRPCSPHHADAGDVAPGASLFVVDLGELLIGWAHDGAIVPEGLGASSGSSTKNPANRPLLAGQKRGSVMKDETFEDCARRQNSVTLQKDQWEGLTLA